MQKQILEIDCRIDLIQMKRDKFYEDMKKEEEQAV